MSEASAAPSKEEGSTSLQVVQEVQDLRQRPNSEAFAALPRLRKNLLYAVLTITLGSSNLGISCLFTTTETIAEDIHLEQGGNAIWIISANAMAFAACIPLGGRLTDISKPHWCFLSGLIEMSALTLGSSFAHDEKLFIALRALQGICAALTMPSSFSMIVHLFPDKKEQSTRLIGASIITALSVISGFAIGAVLEMANWRWIFRFLACVAAVCAISGWLLFPQVSDHTSSTETRLPMKSLEVVKRLDLIGVALIMACLLLFNFALTSATVYGWVNARFIAPFVISLLLVPIFCLWEVKQSEERAMVPVTIVKQKSFLVICFVGIGAEMWFTMTQLGPSRYFQQVLRDSSILIAGKLSAQVFGSIIAGLVHTFYISKRVSAKHRLLAGMLLGVAPGLVLVILSNGGKGLDYWRFFLPGYFFGGFGMMIVFQVISVLVIQSVPSTYSGIASSAFTMSCQTGMVIGSSVQAGLYSAAGDISNWKGHQYGFYFLIAWLAVAMLLVVLFVTSMDPRRNEDVADVD